MKIIIGLGNPGKIYQNTRHNIGHLVIDKMSDLPQAKLFKTDTYMNESGIFVQKKVAFYKINLTDLIVIHDDLDIPIGEYRFQFDRGGAGHHGIESVIQHLNTQAFHRLRTGIGRPSSEIPIEKYVLQPFSPAEKLIIDQTIDKIIKEIPNYIK